ncbi:MAG: hypothetical protein JST93_26945 [Acidobacteria bacterium]|nr:hypothetical protein [Acidobacteriota bacterium]
MIFSLLLLFAQSGLELPPLGYFPARDGRLYPLYGMRGNLVIGTPLEEGVTAAIRMDRTMVTKTAAGIVVGDRVLDREWLRESRVLLMGEEGERAGWIAAADALVQWSSRQVRVAMRAPSGWELVEFDGSTLSELRREPVHGDVVAVDSTGRTWTATGTKVGCGDRAWEMDSLVESLFALREGWVLIRVSGRLFAAQCHAPDLTMVPEPEP